MFKNGTSTEDPSGSLALSDDLLLLSNPIVLGEPAFRLELLQGFAVTRLDLTKDRLEIVPQF
jgi:hypothetical protein